MAPESARFVGAGIVDGSPTVFFEAEPTAPMQQYTVHLVRSGNTVPIVPGSRAYHVGILIEGPRVMHIYVEGRGRYRNG